MFVYELNLKSLTNHVNSKQLILGHKTFFIKLSPNYLTISDNAVCLGYPVGIGLNSLVFVKHYFTPSFCLQLFHPIFHPCMIDR